MASRYYGVNIGGQGPADVSISASTTNRDIELVVDDTNLPAADVTAKHVITDAMEALRAALEQDAY